MESLTLLHVCPCRKTLWLGKTSVVELTLSIKTIREQCTEVVVLGFS